MLAHLNLRDEYLPYKKLIGQVILDVRQITSLEILLDEHHRKILLSRLLSTSWTPSTTSSDSSKWNYLQVNLIML